MLLPLDTDIVADLDRVGAIIERDGIAAVPDHLLLTIAADRSATTRARTLLGHEDPRVRAAAIRLLGHIAGVSVRRELEKYEARSGVLSDEDLEQLKSLGYVGSR